MTHTSIHKLQNDFPVTEQAIFQNVYIGLPPLISESPTPASHSLSPSNKYSLMPPELKQQTWKTKRKDASNKTFSAGGWGEGWGENHHFTDQE